MRAGGRASGLKPRSGKGRPGRRLLLASESVEQLFQRTESVLSKMQLFQFPPEMEYSSKDRDDSWSYKEDAATAQLKDASFAVS